MIRPLTLLSAVAFVFSGAYLFVVKHRAQVLDDQIAAVTQATRLDEQRIRVLQAQWALEADPSRLAQLSTQFTALQPMKPSQLVTLASLGSALPPPGSAEPGANPEDAMPVLPVAVPAPAAVAANAPAMVQMAAARAVTQAPVQLAAVLGTAAAKPPVRVATADAAAPSLPGRTHTTHARRKAGAVPEFAENRPAHEHEFAQSGAIYAPQPLAAPRMPMGAQVMSVRAVAQMAPAPVASVQEDGGSLLGMAQSGSSN